MNRFPMPGDIEKAQRIANARAVTEAFAAMVRTLFVLAEIPGASAFSTSPPGDPRRNPFSGVPEFAFVLGIQVAPAKLIAARDAVAGRLAARHESFSVYDSNDPKAGTFYRIEVGGAVIIELVPEVATEQEGPSGLLAPSGAPISSGLDSTPEHAPEDTPQVNSSKD